MPEGAGDTAEWLNHRRGSVVTATFLMPFAGISFLWFIGVVRDGLGRYEDRFFATVFLGSGLLFLATMFVATTVAGGLVASNTGVIDPAARRGVIEWWSFRPARPTRCGWPRGQDWHGTSGHGADGLFRG